MQKIGVSTIAMMLLAACSNAAETSTAQATTTRPSGDSARLVTVASTASDTAQSAANRCQNIRGQLIDADPVGRNVRDAPNTNGRRLGAIAPPYLGTEGIRFPAIFDIIDSRNGWLLIDNAEFDESLVGPSAPVVFSGRGWISGRGVQVTVQTSLGFAEPNHQSAIAFDARGSGGITGGGTTAEEFRLRGVAGCSGNWVQLDWEAPDYQGVGTVGFTPAAVVSREPLVVRAWHTGICNLQETTCDGVNGDGPFAE